MTTAGDLGTAQGYIKLDSTNFNQVLSAALADLNRFSQSAAALTPVLNTTDAEMGELAQTMQTELAASARAAETASENMREQLDGVNSSASRVSDTMEHQSTATRTATTSMSNCFKKVADIAVKAFAAIGAAASAALGIAVKQGMDFSAAMSQVAATMGTTVDSISNLVDIAMEMGSTTKYTATQAAEALNYLALAGYNAEKQIAALPVVLNLAAAGGMDLARASDMVTDSMSALGISTDELVSFSDKLAKASQKSNTSVAQLGEGILQIGGTAKILKGGVTELNTALGILADNGIKASEGGTTLRQLILNLTAPTEKAAEYMQELGVSAFDMNGNMKPLNETFRQLDEAMAGFTQEERQQALAEIFDARQLKGAEAMLANYGARWDELTGYIENCDGAAADMAETMNDNLTGAITIMSSALEGLALSVFSKFEEPLKKAVRNATSEIDKLNDSFKNGKLAESLERISEAVAKAVESLSAWVSGDALPAVIDGISWLIENASTLKTLIIAIGTAVASWKLSSIVVAGAAAFKNLDIAAMQASVSMQTLTAEQIAFNATVKTNVYMILISAIASLTIAVSTLNAENSILGEYVLVLKNAIIALAGVTSAYLIVLNWQAIKTAAVTAATKIATAAQYVFNGALSACPALIVAAGLVVLTAAVTALIVASNKVREATETTNQSFYEEINAARELREELAELRAAEEENIQSKSNEADALAVLVKKLGEQIDSSGRVIGNERLVKELVEQITELYPGMITLIGDQVEGYDNLTDSLDNYLKKLRQEAKIEGLKPAYQEAVAGMEDNANEIDKLKEKIPELNDAYKSATESLNEYNAGMRLTYVQEQEMLALGIKSEKDYLLYKQDIASSELRIASETLSERMQLHNDYLEAEKKFEQAVRENMLYGEEATLAAVEEERRKYVNAEQETYRKAFLEQQELNEEKKQAMIDNLNSMENALQKLDDEYTLKDLSGSKEHLNAKLELIKSYGLEESVEWHKQLKEAQNDVDEASVG